MKTGVGHILKVRTLCKSYIYFMALNYDLYIITGKRALENYEYSLDLIKNNPDYYVVEKTMENNIRKGISTLNQLGFFSES